MLSTSQLHEIVLPKVMVVIIAGIIMISLGCDSEADKVEARALELESEGRYEEAYVFVESQLSEAEWSDFSMEERDRLDAHD